MRVVLLALFVAGCRWNFEEVPSVINDALTDSTTTDVRANTAFVSSTMHVSNFGGTEVADGECQRLAAATGLPGTFVALLGSSGRAPLDALAGSRGWVDLVGAPIVDAPAGWLDGSMFHALRRDENGTDVGYQTAWLGTTNSHCEDWTNATSGSGGSVATSAAFGAFTISGCGSPMPFICVETGRTSEVTPVRQAGRRVFLTSMSWQPSGGIAGADAVCASDASAHGIAGTFRALLATSTMPDPFTRLSTTGATWIRLDGIALTATAEALASPATMWLDTFSHLTAARTHHPYAYPWTGTATVNCNDWTSSNASARGRSGAAASTHRGHWRGVLDATCDDMRPLLCFEL